MAMWPLGAWHRGAVTCHQPAKRNSGQAGVMKSSYRGRTTGMNIPRQMETCWTARKAQLLQQLLRAYSASYSSQNCQP